MFDRGVNLFEVVMDIRDNLRDNNTDAVRMNLDEVNNASEKIYNMQAIIGSRLNRVYAAETGPGTMSSVLRNFFQMRKIFFVFFKSKYKPWLFSRMRPVQKFTGHPESFSKWNNIIHSIEYTPGVYPFISFIIFFT